jgi:hypothetical protein
MAIFVLADAHPILEARSLGRLLLFSVCLLFSAISAPTVSAAKIRDTAISVPPLELRNIPVEVTNNSSQTYTFGLSVVGFVEGEEFVPFLAIAIDHSGPGPNEWMAVWNLNQGGTGALAQLKALAPNLWGTVGAGGGADGGRSGFPEPVLTWDSKRGRAWRELGWSAAKTANRLIGFFNPGRFAFRNYTYHRDNRSERRFIQTYILMLLYDYARTLHPSPMNLSSTSLTDLKYHLIATRSGAGVFADGEDAPAVVGRFESAIRESIAMDSSYAHDEANQLHLGFEDVPYGLPGRPPIARVGLLTIRKADLPARLPKWPPNNLFDLSFEPYSHPRVRELMDLDPDEPVPLGIYVLGSDLSVKPVLVVDFFNPGNPRLRRASGTMKVALDNFLSVRGIPWIGRLVKGTVGYGIAKKDFPYFNGSSDALGLEATRLFARMGWNFDADINHMMIQLMEDRIANPLVESSDRERWNLKRNYGELLRDDAAALGLFLRRLYENRIRRTLDMGDRAVFAADVALYEEVVEYRKAMATIRRFNRQTHLPSISWETIADAWRIAQRQPGARDLEELETLVARVSELYPERIPMAQRATVRELLNPRRQLAESLGGDSNRLSD